MSPTSKKQSKKRQSAKPNNFLLSIIRYIASFPPYYLVIRLFGAVILLILALSTGELFAKNGLLLVLGVLGYILLIYISGWFEKNRK